MRGLSSGSRDTECEGGRSWGGISGPLARARKVRAFYRFLTRPRRKPIEKPEATIDGSLARRRRQAGLAIQSVI
jgi:hypothetical protein